MPNDLEELIELANKVAVTPQHIEKQRRSFAFGNTHFENALISREMVDREAEKLAQEALTSDDKR